MPSISNKSATHEHQLQKVDKVIAESLTSNNEQTRSYLMKHFSLRSVSLMILGGKLGDDLSLYEW